MAEISQLTEQVQEAPATQSGGLSYFIGTLRDFGASFLSDPLDRAKTLLMHGENQRAVNCLADSRDPEAVAILAEIANSPTMVDSVRRGAITGLGAIATKVSANQEAAIDALLSVSCRGSMMESGLAAAIVGNVLAGSKDLQVHERVSAQIVKELVVSREARLVFRSESGGIYSPLQRFCSIAGSLRDSTSAEILTQALVESKTDVPPHWLLEAASKRSREPGIASAIRSLHEYVRELQKHANSESAPVAAGRILATTPD